MPGKDLITSARMARIRQRGTGIEIRVGKILRRNGFSYRRNVRGLPGSPDFANRSKRWAVFVNGCFWHHHRGCPKATIPKSNSRFWVDKFRANRTRDAVAIRKIRAMGYEVALVWECQVDDIELRLGKIFEASRINSR